jgi:TatD DNase family protein
MTRRQPPWGGADLCVTMRDKAPPPELLFMTFWIDTHCHLDAAEFAPDLAAVRARAAALQVGHCVLPAVAVGNFAAVRQLAHDFGDSYALGIHPLCVPQAQDADLQALDAELARRSADPRLVAVGEIGLDYFVPELCQSPMRERHEYFYREQLKLARQHGLPVMLHVRRSADKLLRHLRELAPEGGWRGTAHAFNGSAQQAGEFIKLGFKLGFGGTVTYEASRQIRRLAATLPLDSLVLETDAPDIAPQWLYTTAAQRAAGQPQGRNEPGELPRIGAVLAGLRGMSPEALAAAITENALQAFPKLRALLPC